MKKRVIDLTLPVHEGMQTYPKHWHPFVEISILGRHGIEMRETRKIVMGTHTGTHIDSPRHFIEGGATVDQIPPENLLGPASLLDLTHIKARTEVSVADLEKASEGLPLDKVLIRHDWCENIGTMDYYSEQPYLSEDAAKWLVDQGCHLVGFDVAMPDDPRNGFGCDKDSPNHKTLLKAGVVIVEYMCNLAAIEQKEFFLVVAPLKIQDGDGAPARCFAVLES